jgi:hypothetical protein
LLWYLKKILPFLRVSSNSKLKMLSHFHNAASERKVGAKLGGAGERGPLRRSGVVRGGGVLASAPPPHEKGMQPPDIRGAAESTLRASISS